MNSNNDKGEEFFVNPDDLDLNFEGDPLAPPPAPAPAPNGVDAAPKAMSQADLMEQIKTLQQTAARLESMLHPTDATPQELPTETKQVADQSDTWAPKSPENGPVLPPLPPPSSSPRVDPRRAPSPSSDPFADPFADPFEQPADPFGQPSEPFTPQPEPFAPQPEPFAPQPEPFAPQPEPFTPQPEPFTPQPEPFTPQPEPFAPQPEPFAPQPEPFTPQPEPFAPQPEPFTPQPEPFAPEPVPAAVQPQAPQNPYTQPDDPYAQPAVPPHPPGPAYTPEPSYTPETRDPYDRPAAPQPVAPQPSPVYSDPHPQLATTSAYAPAGMQGSPLDQFLAQDVLAAISNQGGNGRVIELQQEAALTRLREESRARRDKEARTSKKTRGRGAPRFIRVKTRFRPGDPLVISVTSPKGGVGKSTTAANLAAYYAKAAAISNLESEVRVLLVDGDVANGNLALRVAQRLEPNMLDLLNHMDEVRAAGGELDAYQRDMAPFVLAHPKIDNLDILAAPDNPDVLEQIEQEDLEYLMATFARFYQIVVFDTGTQIVEHTNCAWLNFSSQVYLMVEPEIACLQVTAEYAKRARRLQLITPEVCRLVMIRADMDLENLDPKQVAQAVFSFIRPDRAFFIPDFHRDAIETGNAGEFLVLDSADYAEALTPIISSSLENYEAGT